MLYLTEEEVASLLPMAEAVPVIERALRADGEGRIVSNTRRRLRLKNALLMSLESGDIESGFTGHKNYLAVPGKGVLAHFFLYECASRQMVAIMRANELGRIRTGATTGVATRYLAREDAHRHAVFGAGYQGETQVLAVSQARQIDEIRVWSRTRERAEQFCARLRPQLPEARIEPALDDPAELAAWGDIVTVATRASTPVLKGSWLRPGVLVNAMGSNALDRAEIDVEAVGRANLVVADSVEGAQVESGDLFPAVEQGVLFWGAVHALSDVVAGYAPGRRDSEEIILFESQGLALEDLAAGTYVYHKALETGIGRQLDIE
jgi:ornithine cyclodeaminase/alanine dehydrogenase-like protein (mu-crystallin family)